MISLNEEQRRAVDNYKTRGLTVVNGTPFFALEIQRKDDMYYRMSDRGEVISFFIRTMNKESNRTLNDEERGRSG